RAVDDDDVRMRDRRGRARLEAEARDELDELGELGREDLEGDGTSSRRLVAREEDRAHAAASETLDDDARAEPGAGGELDAHRSRPSRTTRKPVSSMRWVGVARLR